MSVIHLRDELKDEADGKQHILPLTLPVLACTSVHVCACNRRDFTASAIVSGTWAPLQFRSVYLCFSMPVLPALTVIDGD